MKRSHEIYKISPEHLMYAHMHDMQLFELQMTLVNCMSVEHTNRFILRPTPFDMRRK